MHDIEPDLYSTLSNNITTYKCIKEEWKLDLLFWQVNVSFIVTSTEIDRKLSFVIVNKGAKTHIYLFCVCVDNGDCIGLVVRKKKL